MGANKTGKSRKAPMAQVSKKSREHRDRLSPEVLGTQEHRKDQEPKDKGSSRKNNISKYIFLSHFPTSEPHLTSNCFVIHPFFYVAFILSTWSY